MNTMHQLFKKSLLLKNLSAALLLAVFSLGITPKSTLHSWFANHKDSTATIPGGTTKQYTTAGINCHCENLVAESHFLEGSVPVLPSIVTVKSDFLVASERFISITPLSPNLRGPPSL